MPAPHPFYINIRMSERLARRLAEHLATSGSGDSDIASISMRLAHQLEIMERERKRRKHPRSTRNTRNAVNPA